MIPLAAALAILPAFLTHYVGAVDISSVAPTVVLDKATFVGVGDGTTRQFLGIPYAQPPVGDLRFRLPVANAPYTGVHSAVNFGPACLQQNVGLPLLPSPEASAVELIAGSGGPTSEDCLSVNVFTPVSAKPGAKLPVLVWFYGGGDEFGQSSQFNGSAIVSRSVQLKESVVYVSLNYRLSALGFIGGKEALQQGVANLGYQDQRQALRWVQKYIKNFGGDPSKVTIWGQSAGAIAVGHHMITNGGNPEGLFRAAIMNSGSPYSILDVADPVPAQNAYNTFVSVVGCSNATDTLACLRQAPVAKIQSGMDASSGLYSYTALNVTWGPHVDGKFFTDTPQNLIAAGKVAKIPFISGNVDDEGTVLALPSVNITTDDQFRTYISTLYLSNFNSSVVDQVVQLYPSDPAQGSPFDTGSANAITPQFKRVAAFIGDYIFQAPRRLFAVKRASKQNVWCYLEKRLKFVPTIGAAHTTDLDIAYGPGDMTDYYVNFVNHLNPNGPSVLVWPQYNTSTSSIIMYQDGATPLAVGQDNYRADALAYLGELRLVA